MFWSSGFWADGFWSPAFWDGQEIIPAKVGGGPGDDERKKHIVRVGDRLLVFAKKSDALAATERTGRSYPAKKKQIIAKTATPEKAVDLIDVKQALKDQLDLLDTYLRQKQYEALLREYEDWQDEQDIELLLMAA